ncbi:MAG: SDR family oxidoreductase [Hyphomonadaceae bacterium]|nr:SDR family oxidoreductase [Hyphomonadaceae bacterium]
MKRTALVTGGGSGIGLAIAQRLAEAGHEVYVAGRNAARLEQTGFKSVQMDVTEEASVAAAIRQIDRIDILVANAGAAATAPLLKTSLEDWVAMTAVNLTGPFLCARAALPQMRDRGWGRFIAVASTASLKGYAYTGAYAAAKHGVLGLVKTLAIELATSGITSNAVCPGFTNTDIISNSVQNIVSKTGRTEADALSTFTRANPMQRLIEPNEVAEMVAFLASDGAAGINGQAIAIDGGETIS